MPPNNSAAIQNATAAQPRWKRPACTITVAAMTASTKANTKSTKPRFAIELLLVDGLGRLGHGNAGALRGDGGAAPRLAHRQEADRGNLELRHQADKERAAAVEMGADRRRRPDHGAHHSGAGEQRPGRLVLPGANGERARAGIEHARRRTLLDDGLERAAASESHARKLEGCARDAQSSGASPSGSGRDV